MKNNTIKLFMWGYQQHFRISLNTAASELFKRVDDRFSPNVFLLGLLVEDLENRHPVCLEPEDCGFDVDSFKNIDKLAKQLQKVDQESKIIHSQSIAQKKHDKHVSDKAYAEAVSKILKREDIYSNTKRFISRPIFVNGYKIFVILELQKDVINRHYSLTKEKVDDRYNIDRSFIESVINKFLESSRNALKDPNNAVDVIERSPSEIIREAGKHFMYTVSQAGKNFDGLHGLYEACNEIASMKYEGGVGLGKMIVAPKDHQNVKITLQLKEPISIRDYRKVRKFLELSDSSSSIITDSALIYGLGKLRGNYNPKEESIFVINFTSHFKWELTHNNNSLMVVEYRQPSLPTEKIDRDKFYSILDRIFNNINKDQIDDLWDLTMEATKQQHGTMLVISEDADSESERLGNQCFPLNPLKLTPDIMQQVTSIDGAVLLDKNSYCHAIGVILDGLATTKGDSSRGARYNSAVRYYEHFGDKTSIVLIIISEDGMINLIPNLKPQIKHSDITTEIKEFEKLSEQDEIDLKYFHQKMDYFEAVNFYLTEDECNKINRLRKKIEEKDDSDGLKIKYPDLEPDEEMDDSYYLDE